MRFKQYDINWDKKSLSNFAKKIIKKNSNNDIKNVISNSAQSGLIPQLDFFDKKIANDENTAGYYIINKGDFVYNPRKSLSAPYGPVNIYKYEKTGIVSPLYLCFSVEDIDTKYLLQRFKSNCWHRYIYLNGDLGARHDRVSIKDDVFLSQPIYVPSIEEQTKIANFLEKIDERIEVQNKIISKYETLIKGIYTYLQKKIHTQKYRLSDIATYHSVGLLSKDDLCKQGGNKCVLYGELFTTYGEVIIDVKSNTDADGYRSNGNEILFPSSTTVDSLSLISPSALNESNVVLGGDMFVLSMKKDFNNEYVSYYFNTVAKRQLAKFAQGTTITHLYYEHIKGFVLKLPSYTIQLKIAAIMMNLQQKVITEKRMLSALQKQKAFLLQSMFI